MKNKRTKKGLQAGLALGILVVLIMPMSIISATDNTPPVIDPNSLYFDPPLYVGPLGDSYVYVMCIVTDNVAVADVRLVITGPGGYQSNESCSPGYYYEGFVQPLPSYGTYASHVFAIDTSGNTVVSDTFYSLIMENPLPYVYVDNDAVFPFDGSSAHPFPTITLGLSAVGVNGTVFVRNGFYHENVWMASTINLIGESKENVIIQAASGYDQAIKFGLYVNHSSVSNVTIQGGIISGILFELANNNTVHNCIIRNNPTGIFVGVSPYNTITNCDIINNGVGILMYSYEAANSFYHNNFINNTVHVGGTMNANTWDNGVTGNYWDNYSASHPNAHIIPATGTWDQPYTISSMMNVDHHPWVYPNGFIDTIAPTVVLTYPNGGETISGSITITWTASDDLTSNLNGRIGLSYSADAGTTWHTIVQHLNNTGSYIWDTNTVADGTQYMIKVNASDEFQNVGSDASDNVFIILNHPNQAPNKPRQPTGPASGYVGTEYTYTSNTTDSNNDQVYYKWSWGTEESDWMGPYASGATVSASHIWSGAGTVDVKVKAKDTNDAESNWSTILPVTISEQPQLEITLIKGGFGVSAVIKNNGNVDATNVSWSIVLSGGIILKGNETKGTITTLAAGAEETVHSGLILGIGKTVITVHATCEEESEVTGTANGFVFLFFVIGAQ